MPNYHNQSIEACLKELKTTKEGLTQKEANRRIQKNGFNKLDQIKTELESDNIMLSDIALNHIMKGELIELTDGNNKYEPQFTVQFKKI